MLIPPSVYALNANTGALRWSYLTAQNVGSSPAVVNGVVYIASGDSTTGSGTVYALSASTGALLWSLSRPTAVESSPAVANGVVYFGDDGGEVSAVNASPAHCCGPMPPEVLWNPRPQCQTGWFMSALLTATYMR